jgi:DNA-binding CsgD family transcriptional regulator
MAAPQLLERAADLREAETLLSAAQDGAGSALLVEGPAGIGKSALIRAVRERASAQGFAVLTARGAELEREFSFGVVRQLFEPALAMASQDERDALLAGAAHLAEPAIGQLDVSQPSAPSSASPSLDPFFKVLHGLYWLTSNMSERAPLMLVVDDAHWADPASLRFLVYLAGRLEGLPTMLIIGLRRFEPDSPEELISALTAEDASHVMRLAPLSEAGSDALVRSRLEVEPAPGFASECHRATGGNPQLIRELLAALAAEGIEPTPAGAEHIAALRADRIAGSVLARVGRVGATAVSAAQAIAVLGRDATPTLVAELAGLAPDEAARVVDSLVQLEILLPGNPIAFAHPIVRTAVYRDFASAERGRAHARAARLLTDNGADLDSVVAQILATPTGSDEWAITRLASAAERALSSGAPDAAVAYLERLLAENPSTDARRQALVGLGRAFAMLRDPRRSIKRLQAALELTNDPVERAAIVDILVAEMLVSRAAARAVKLLDEAIEGLPESELELGLRLESDIDSGSFFSLNAKRAGEHRKRRFDDPDDPRMLAGRAMMAALYGGTAQEAAALARQAASGARLLRDGPDSPAIWTAGFAFLYAHELTEARRVADDWAREAGRQGSLRAYSLASSLRTRATYWSGDLAEAEADARAFIEGMPEALALGPAFLADTLMDQGRLDEADAAIALAERADVEVEWSFFYPMLLYSRGVLKVLQGAVESGCDSLLEAGRAAGEWGIRGPGPLQWRPAAAEALASLGEFQRAGPLIEEELASCRVYGSPRALGIALRAAGAIEEGPERIEHLSEAAELLSRSDSRLEHARALVELGAALRRARRPADARQPFRDGLALARACGALPLAERAHEELTATGARPRKIVRAGAEALTSSERRVARMAADGMSNKEIAQALFVTVRTVEAHLHHAYQKLDISSRDQLAGALAAEPGEPASV